jgi:hypothetical protein
MAGMDLNVAVMFNTKVDTPTTVLATMDDNTGPEQLRNARTQLSGS